ncbi:MAG: hypothetical protein KG028_07480 [Actinobacteria bacterium]|nr:hypothetical protein [Actinomycetota bacterium]
MRMPPRLLLGAAILTAAGCATGSTAPAPVAGTDLPRLVVHKTATCTCCAQYEDYLAAHDVDLEVVVHDDLDAVKADFAVPGSQRSCHTNEIGGYYVEGHVPLEAIADLLEQAPDVDGIALAGMPSGSPGMPGEQTEPFLVTTSVDGEVVGELGRY